MSKVTMPEPEVYRSKDTPYLFSLGGPGTEDFEGLITTSQAEAYTQERVREALEKAAGICDARAMKNEAAVSDDEPNEASSLRSAAWQMGVCAREIRALIPKEAT